MTRPWRIVFSVTARASTNDSRPRGARRDATHLCRYDGDGTVVSVAQWVVALERKGRSDLDARVAYGGRSPCV
jgi:hypothetical protein